MDKVKIDMRYHYHIIGPDLIELEWVEHKATLQELISYYWEHAKIVLLWAVAIFFLQLPYLLNSV